MSKPFGLEPARLAGAGRVPDMALPAYHHSHGWVVGEPPLICPNGFGWRSTTENLIPRRVLAVGPLTLDEIFAAIYLDGIFAVNYNDAFPLDHLTRMLRNGASKIGRIIA